MGPHDAKLESLRKLFLTEEAPNESCQNCFEIARTNYQIFGGTFFCWPKVVRRFLAEAIYGIQTRQSVHLTEIARSLGEKIPLKKTQYRLCRQLGRRGLWAKITDFLCRMASSRVKENTLLVLDISDIAKKYAQKMQYLARVHDGSEGTLANGYWTCSVVGAESAERTLTPLYSRLYSQAGPDASYRLHH